MAPRATPLRIAQELSTRDSRVAHVISLVGEPPSRRPLAVAKRFERLATAILHQQLAGAAAATITTRVIDALGGAMTTESLLAAPPGVMRACGVSGAKEAALLDLATRVTEGRLRIGQLGRMSDSDVIDVLTEVRGIGPWTAQMFLMGPLARENVWPVGDLGVRNGWSIIQRKRSTITPELLERKGATFEPFRSALAWYCWQAVDLARGNGGVLPPP
ncbi:unannotated protein [freshwater metagenome]|uniref:Unannotated protein n=1 Tax=freshwater metagenome TaxID=449393 RepID=A0A6J7CZB3_9ZZZZ